eukprot:CAMPEP_0172699012 /NCGR_PEP_ID=MMETSP1074-20121228/29872_1 /TAXON_ID=2916 /ORGANISM="Ceratium fusus, Strain PA161109" /LENGTH=291 /DNA_ID=CAMNT_0013520141 /DNA_START=26 /DNA_END=901 /DNA_ORIENTATION=-
MMAPAVEMYPTSPWPAGHEMPSDSEADAVAQSNLATLAQGSELNGWPLEAPRLARGHADNCDGYFMEPPSFVLWKDSAEQHSNTWSDDVPLPLGASVLAQGSKIGTSFARMVHGILEPSECAELVSWSNKKGFKALGNRYRCMIDCPAFTSYLFQVLRPYLPEALRHGREQLEELNERCRFLCYTPGQEFSEHCDACYERPRGHPKEGQISRITVQLYLHNVPHENGGATTFLGRERVHCQPRCGSALLFTQDLRHEGSILSAGLKYTMRTEVMYKEDQEAKALQDMIDSI